MLVNLEGNPMASVGQGLHWNDFQRAMEFAVNWQRLLDRIRTDVEAMVQATPDGVSIDSQLFCSKFLNANGGANRRALELIAGSDVPAQLSGWAGMLLKYVIAELPSRTFTWVDQGPQNPDGHNHKRYFLYRTPADSRRPDNGLAASDAL